MQSPKQKEAARIRAILAYALTVASGILGAVIGYGLVEVQTHGDRGVWLFLADRVLRVEAGAVQRWPKPAGTTAYGCVEDAQGLLDVYRAIGAAQRYAEIGNAPVAHQQVALDGRRAGAVQDADGAEDRISAHSGPARG